MGWTFLYNAPEKRHVIDECTRSTHYDTCVVSVVYGNNLWTIWYNSLSDTKTISLFKLGKDNGSWGYKEIPESMGPAYYDCPESFLDSVPEINRAWRTRVRDYHAKEKKRKETLKSLKIGSMVRLENCKPSTFRVTSLKPLLGSSSSGNIYKLTKTKITEVF